MKNSLLVLATMLIAGLGAPLQSQSQAQAQNEGSAPCPNILLIFLDDLGYADVGFNAELFGVETDVVTPNIDALAKDGTIFKQAYVAHPFCGPSRMALLSGRMPHCYGGQKNLPNEALELENYNEKGIPVEETLISTVLQDAGYRTGCIGKWHLGDTYPFAPRFRGFGDVVCHRSGGVDEIGNPKGNNYFDDIYFRNGVAEKFEGYCTDVFFDELLRFIGDDGEKRETGDGPNRPFFAYLPLNAMHGPFTVDDSYSDRFRAMGMPEDRAEFYGMVENFDENLGRLLAYLKQKQIDDNTVVIFMGDNGSAGGARIIEGHECFNAGMRGAKGDVYEGGHRVGCFIRWPGQFPAGRAINALTAHHDWLPTLIDLCRLDLPKPINFDGRSLVPLLKGDVSSWAEPRTVFVVRHAGQPKMWTEAAHAEQRYPRRAVLIGRWRLVDGELYDIAADPGQQSDVAADHPDMVKKLATSYREWWQDAMSHGAAYTRFVLGADEENPTSFSVRDWHPTEGRVIWKKPQLAEDDRFINGFWPVEVRSSGSYRIILRRFPEDKPKAMGATRIASK